MLYQNENKTDKATTNRKPTNENYKSKKSTLQINDTKKEANDQNQSFPADNLAISSNEGNLDNENQLTINSQSSLDQPQLSSTANNLSDENIYQEPSNPDRNYQTPLPISNINISHDNNTDKKSSKDRNSISFTPKKINKSHSPTLTNSSSNLNRHIENKSILPNKPPSNSRTTRNTSNTDNQSNSSSIPLNKDFYHHNSNVSDDHNSYNRNQRNPPNNNSSNTHSNDNNNNNDDNDDDDHNEMMSINVDTERLSNPYENIPDLDQGKEVYNLSGMKPLKTVVYLSIGPLVNQVTSAVESFVETIWVSKAIGKEGMSAVSSYMPFENITRAFGLTAACAGSNSISGMIATKQADKEEGSQVIADLLRVCLIIGIIVPCVLCPLVKMAVKWLGASEIIVKLGYRYILPILVCTFFTCMYLGITGFLEGEGRPILYSVITVCTTVANIGFLCPLFLFSFKTGIVGAGLAQALSHAISGTVLFVLYFTGAFTVKPKFSQLFKKFSPLTKGALKACLSQGIANLALSVPAILIRKLLGMLSISEEEYNNSVTGFHAVTRYTQIVEKIIIAFVTGYLPGASFAYNNKDYKRWLFLTLHVNWLCFAWGSLSSILTFTIPRQLAEAFLKNSSYVDVAKPMIKISNSGGFFVFAQYTVGNMLRSLKMGFMAAVMGTLVHIVAMIGFSLMLYYTNKHDAVRLMYAYPLSNLFGLVAAGAFIAYPSYLFRKEWKFNQENGINNDEISPSQPLPRLEVANLDAMN